jgi:filamentous hemagglutinin family protein
MIHNKFSQSFLTLTGLVFSTQTAIAQIYQPTNRTPVADTTLNTQVSGNGNSFNITGGLNKGQTLFHSFGDFSVPTNGQANFLNPVGNRDIITRVTGNLFSDINGLVNTSGANFFLINPNGMIFGPNAQLNVGKAFVGSTGNSIDLVDGGGRAITFGANPSGDAPLLSIAPNVLFNVSRLNMGGSVSGNSGIVNYGILQTNNDSQYIGLFGGNVTLDGRYGGGIIAPGGRVDLGGLTTAGTISVDNNGLVFGGNGLGRSDVSLINGARVTVSANQNLGTVDTFFNNATSPGSSLNVSANNVSIINDRSTENQGIAYLDAGFNLNTGVKIALGGDVRIDATGMLTMLFGSIYNTIESGSEGKVGDIKINASSIEMFDEANILSRLNGKGDAGNIDINSTGDITILGTTNESLLQGDNTDALSRISSNTNGQGNTGKITINTQGNLFLANRSGILSNVNETGVGNSKGIDIKAKDLSLVNLSKIQSGNAGGIGDAGNVDITTTGNVNIIGTLDPFLLQGDTTQALSEISSVTQGKGNAGKVTINAQGNLSISDRSGIFNYIDNTGSGTSQGVSITAKDLSLTDFGYIQSGNYGGTGDGGNVDITTTGKIDIIGTSNQSLLQGDKIQDLSEIASITQGKGNAGKVTINAQGNLSIANRGGIVNYVDTTGSGNSQGVSITAKDVSLANFGNIQSGNYGGTGDAGNIDVTTTGNLAIVGTFDPTLLTGDNTKVISEISSVTSGKGTTGKITINNQGYLLVANRGGILTNISEGGEGNSKGIDITTSEVNLGNFSTIRSANFGGKGNAGNIDIKTTGDINIAGVIDPQSPLIVSSNDSLSDISSSTYGKGDTGKITIDATGDINLRNGAGIFSSIVPNSTPIFDSQGIEITAEGNSQGIEIKNARNLNLTDFSTIQSTNFGGTGNAGNITIKNTGDINITGADLESDLFKSKPNYYALSGIYSSTDGKGDAGKITLDTTGDINISNRGGIFSAISSPIATENSNGIQVNAEGNSQGVEIKNARNLNLTNYSNIQSDNFGGKGNAGNIDIKITGDINIFGVDDSQSSLIFGSGNSSSNISSSTYGKGDTGKITLDATGDINLRNGGGIFSSISPNSTTVFDREGIEIKAEGTSQGINIKNARNLNLSNLSTIQSTNFGGTGNAGNIDIKTTGDLNISGIDDPNPLFENNPNFLALSAIFTSTYGKGDTGKITIDTAGDINLNNRAGIFSQISGPIAVQNSATAKIQPDGNSQGIDIKNARNLNLSNYSTIQSTNFGATGNAGNIDIKITGDVKITGVFDSQSSVIPESFYGLSSISSSTRGKGDTGKITIDTIGDITLSNGAAIFSGIIPNAIPGVDSQGVAITADGNSQGIEIKNARNLTVTNFSNIRSDNFGGKGNAGNIDVKITGDINITGVFDPQSPFISDGIPISFISSSTYGKGDTGKITIDTTGDINLNNRGGIFSVISSAATGKSQGIEIKNARNLTLTNFGTIQSDNFDGTGNAGKITIDKIGKLSLSTQAGIYSTIGKKAGGDSEGIAIDANEVELNNNSIINTTTSGTGNAGSIKIDANEVSLKNNSSINTSTFGTGNAGSIKIATKGNYTADDYSFVFATTAGDGDAGNIDLNSQSVTLRGGSQIQALSNAKGKAGNLTVTTPIDGFITISGNAPSGKLSTDSLGGFASALLATAEKDSSSFAGKISITTGTLNLENSGSISTRTRTKTSVIQPNDPNSLIVGGKYPVTPGAGSIEIDAKNINISGGGQISTTSTGNASAGDVILKNPNAKLVISGNDPNYEQRKADLATAYIDGVLDRDPTEIIEFSTVPVNQYSGIFANNGIASTGKGGSILINPQSVTITDSGQISVSNQGTGEGGNIFLISNILSLNNGQISAESKNATGGDINLNINDYLLLRNGSGISTNSESSGQNGNGGNISIDSPLIITLPGNNDITANASAGNGGKVTIVSQGLFGIQNRAQSPLTSDITASSTFGQSGSVNIDTPGTDPGKDSTELPNTTTDASNQISQVCSANNRQNKLTVTGRGGLPPNANDSLTADVVWQDPRAISSPPAVTAATIDPVKLAPPAVGWVFDGKGKVTLIAASTDRQPTGTSVVCPNVVK